MQALTTTQRCTGYKENGERCARPVATWGIGANGGWGAAGGMVPVRCQHHPYHWSEAWHRTTQGIWLQRGAVVFSWLDSQANYKVWEEIRRPRHVGEADGYIYVYQVYDTDEQDIVRHKVGYTNDLDRRMAEWARCASQSGVLRRVWYTQHARRLERLAHLALRSLGRHAPYYRASEWPNVAGGDGLGLGEEQLIYECEDCDVEHTEIMTFSLFVPESAPAHLDYAKAPVLPTLRWYYRSIMEAWINEIVCETISHLAEVVDDL